MKLHRDMGITQKTAWFNEHRISEELMDVENSFDGTVKGDETYIGGIEGNKHESMKLKVRRCRVGMSVVIGVKEHDCKEVKAKVVEIEKRRNLT